MILWYISVAGLLQYLGYALYSVVVLGAKKCKPKASALGKKQHN